MNNKLENLCGEKGIKVEFISYNFIDSADERKNSQPVIKVHKIFRECPMKVATAIVEIFTGEGYTSECIEIIECYLKEKFGPIGIKLKPPKTIIKGTVNKEVNPPSNIKEKFYSGKEEKYTEAEIFSIDVTNMKAQQEKLKGNESLLLKEQDVLELDIAVSPPLHK